MLVVAEHYRDPMERQVVIELAGGVAEAIYRSERRKEEVLRFAIRHCCIGTDLKRARAVLGDLRRLTGVRFDAQPFAERARALLLDRSGQSPAVGREAHRSGAGRKPSRHLRRHWSKTGRSKATASKRSLITA